MRIWELFDLGMRYLIPGIFFVIVMGMVLFCSGRIWEKRCGKKENFPWRKIILYGCFVCYLLVVLGATMLSRGNIYENVIRMRLFYSYRDAWNDFSMTEWRNIILNILMFVPLGVMLPYMRKIFQSAGWTYLAGFGLTLLIEMMQLIFKCGIFELDDLMNNLVGTMIGYGLYRLLKCFHDKKSLWYQIPLVLTVAVFVWIFVIYDRQELGNLHSEYIARQEGIRVETALEFSEDTLKLPVYQVPMLTLKDTAAKAEEIFAMFGDELNLSTEDAYENMVLYYSENQKSIWIDYRGGTYRYADFDLMFGDEMSVRGTDVEEDMVRQVLKDACVKLPRGMVFAPYENGYGLKANMILQDDLVYDGVVECEYTPSGGISRLDYSMVECSFYKDFEVISQAEAYRRLKNGEFYYPQDAEWMIQIYDVYLVYEIDSKGFYQPVYRFDAFINDNDGYIIIPAIDK